MADSPTPVDPTSNPEVPPTTTDTVPVGSVEIAPAAVDTALNPEVPQPITTAELPIAPPPDAAYIEAQATQQDRWQQAAATNPEGINNNGSVTTDLGGGQKETVNRDGSYSISGPDGTIYYDAVGKETAYTTPTVDGLSVTTTTDGIQYTNYSQGPLTTSTITKDGEPISTTVTYDTGTVTLTSTQVAGGEIVNSASTIVEGDKITGYTIADTVQVGDGEIITQNRTTPAYEELKQAYDADVAANQALVADALKYKQQLAEGLPEDPTQVAYLGEQAEIVQQADANLATAEENLAAVDPFYVSLTTDPQVDNAPSDTTPLLDTQVSPATISTAVDPEITEPQIAVSASSIDAGDQLEVSIEINPEIPQPTVDLPTAAVDTGSQINQVSAVDNPELPQVQAEIPTTSIDTGAATNEISATEDPQIPADGELPAPIEYTVAEAPTEDPVVIAQAEITITDVPSAKFEISPLDTPVEQVGDRLVDLTTGQSYAVDPVSGFLQSGQEIFVAPEDIPVEQVGDRLVDLTTGQSYAIDAETGFIESGDGELISPENIPIEYQGDRLVDVNTGETLGIDPESGFLDNGQGLYVSPQDLPVTRQGDVLVDAASGQEYPIDPDSGFVNNNDILISAEDIPVQREGDVLVDLNSGQEYPIDPDTGFVAVNDIYVSPEDLAAGTDPQVPEGGLVEFTANGDVVRSAAEIAAINQQATLDNARKQATLKSQRKQVNDRDWRVRLRLAPGATYLYNAPAPGILYPLRQTDGVIFPYTPTIQTVYRAVYNSYDLTHSNYRGFFYQGSKVEDIQVNAIFTAQDTAEAEYLLAVIHFFRSCTKMFYGQDAQRGAPPPLCYLSGFGQYQFQEHPVAVAQFNYNLPADVDYIRVRSPNINGTNMLVRRNRQDLPTNPISGALQRLANAGVKKGALPSPPAPPTLGTDSPTYVPTKMEISLILHPMQSREQVSKQFSVKQFANGDLLKGGFW